MFQPPAVITSEIKAQQTKMFVVFGVGLLLALCKFSQNASYALNEILVLMLFLCGTMYANFCLLVFFIVLTMFGMVNYLIEIGILAQLHYFNGFSPFNRMDGKQKFYSIVVILTVIFDIAAIYITFHAYRVFKHESFKGIGGDGPSNIMMRDRTRPDNRSAPSNAFQGTGIRIGG